MLPAVVDSRGADIGMPQPGMDLGDIRLMLQGIGRRRGAQAVHPQSGDRDAGGLGVLADQRIDAMGRDADPRARTPQRHEQRRPGVDQGMPGPLQVGMQALMVEWAEFRVTPQQPGESIGEWR